MTRFEMKEAPPAKSIPVLQHQTQCFTILAPYPEGALSAISNYLAENGLLRRHVRPSKLANRFLSRLVAATGPLSIAERLAKGTAVGPQFLEVARLLEPLRLVTGILSEGMLQRDIMYANKKYFDRVASQAISSQDGIVIGMAGACLQSFKATPFATRVLHVVDSHPRVHNESLVSHFPRRLVAREMIPESVVERIESEIYCSDVILTPTRFVEHQFRTRGMGKHTLLRIPYGVDFTDFQPATNERQSSSKQIRVLFVGQISFRKGISILLAAARQVKITLILAGPMVSKLVLKNMPSNATYVGPKSKSEIVGLMQSADAFVLPSIEDACALVVGEAVAVGLPVITTYANGASELLAPADLRLVPPGNVQELALALSEIAPLTRMHAVERAARLRAPLLADKQDASLVTWTKYSALVTDALISLKPTSND